VVDLLTYIEILNVVSSLTLNEKSCTLLRECFSEDKRLFIACKQLASLKSCMNLVGLQAIEVGTLVALFWATSSTCEYWF
jgi:hypothetical protein